MQDQCPVPLEAFEASIYNRDWERAVRYLLTMLRALNEQNGAISQLVSGRTPEGLSAAECDLHLLTRLAGAIGNLFASPEFSMSDEGFDQLIALQRWLALIFTVTPFRHTDHLIEVFNLNRETADQGLRVENRFLHKLVLLYSPESQIPLDLDALWAGNPRLTASLTFNLLAPRLIGSTAAHHKRETILGWLPNKLAELDDLTQVPVGVLHDVYMHCSYADRPDRHEIKRSINLLVRRKLLAEGFKDRADVTPAHFEGKPVMLVLVEWFSSGHSIYRTHSRSLEGARKHFHVVAAGSAANVDDVTRAVFDTFVELDFRQPFCGLAAVLELAEQYRPSVFYMPSIGMFPVTIFASNLRLAPIQAVALGHPATTHSPYIDYVVVEDDYVGDPDCFSELLLRIPNTAMPYRPSRHPTSAVPILREKVDRVRIAVASSPMKLNPKFLDACRLITLNSRVPVQLQFMVGIAQGLTHLQVKALIHQYVPNAVVHGHQDYDSYMRALAVCDMFINPFPFGNTNGLVDTALLGLAGVCKSGPEVFEHIDEAIFRRIGLPESLIAHSVPEYIAMAIKLAENHAWRYELRRDMLARNAVQNMFEGDATLMGAQLLAKVPHEHNSRLQAEAPG